MTDTPAERLDAAVRAVDAPDVVFAMSVHGQRFLASGGSRPPGRVPRGRLRYEIGSASKTFTGLTLARLARAGVLSAADPAAAHLAPGRPAGPEPVRLTHLITHTSGLPALPADFYPQAVAAWSDNPYAGYGDERVVRAFLRSRPRHRPGSRWHYSNFAVAVLGHAMCAATATGWPELLAAQVLSPLGLAATSALPGRPGEDAVGHRRDGVGALPPVAMGGFQAAGAVRSTPHDLLAFLEAHLRPERTALRDELLGVRRPLLRRGYRRRHVHTLTWFRHTLDGCPVYFHGGATFGQQAFLGFRPGTGTAVVGLATRRVRGADRFAATAYALLG